MHAADVFNSLYFFISNSELEKFITPYESVACLISSLGHDLGHPGLTNRYLINSRDKLAMRYNDNSVLENMHCSMIYALLSEPGCDILSEIPPDQWVYIRKLIIEMVLHTDMSRHFEILGRFRTRFLSLNDLDLEKSEDKIFVLAVGLKCADIGHTAKTFELHQKWTYLVCEEFFNQGDLERSKDMPISMYCDRNNADIPKSQIGFIKNVCLPLYEIFVAFLRSNKIEKNCVDQIRENLMRWEESSKIKIINQSKFTETKEDFLVKLIDNKEKISK